MWAGGLSKHSTSAVMVPVPLNFVCPVAFHPVSLANGLLCCTINNRVEL